MDSTSAPSRPRRPAVRLRSEALHVVGDDLAYQARVLGRLISAFMDRRLAATGLTGAQFTLMCLVAAAADDSIGALAERGGFDQSTLSRNLDALARAGLIEIVTTEKDRRRRAVWLSERGARRLQAAMRIWRSAHDEIDRVVGREAAGAVGSASDSLRRLIGLSEQA